MLPLPLVPLRLQLTYEDHQVVDASVPGILSVLQPTDGHRETNETGQLTFQVRIEQASQKHGRWAVYMNL
jgi:hypothetical protein